MTRQVKELFQKARAAEAGGRPKEALKAIRRAVQLAEPLSVKFDALLHRARLEAAPLGELDTALDTYWEARHLTRKHALGRAGEADLGIGMTLLDLDREGEGLEAIRRAARYFRKAGDTYLRGCAETLLADEALKNDLADVASRHLEVASDLLTAAAEPRMLSNVRTLQAEIMAREGEEGRAEELLAEAAQLASEVHDDGAESELRSRRRAVRAIIAVSLPRDPEQLH